MISSTIAAIATPAGRGGIGIVRISGPRSFFIGSQLFKPHKDPPRQNSENHFPYKSHHVYFGKIHNFNQTTVLDEVLIIFMKAPNSYTREDVVEIHGHAGIQTLTLILKAVFAAGAEPAEPGEFTKRAYLNGRIDLTQAEAVIDLINARSELAREVAFSQLSGNLKDTVADFQNILMAALTRFQAEIEFPDEVAGSIHTGALIQEMQDQVIAPIQKLIDNHDQSFFLTQGLRAIIIGEPNVGKSSLMNCLARKEKSIVTPYPGTTRDLIEEHVQFCGTPMVLADTAGLHESEDPIETIGIDIALKQIHSADLVLFVIQAGRLLTDNETRICDLLVGKPVIFTFNKTDLVPDLSPTALPSAFSVFPSIYVSAREKTGIDSLEQEIEDFITRKISIFHDPVLPNVRQKEYLRKSLNAMHRFVDGLSNNIPSDLLVMDLDEALQSLHTITGQVFQIDLLDQIFNNFCIGK